LTISTPPLLLQIPRFTSQGDRNFDIMAEVVLGAVASGITVGALVAQVTCSVVKLKSYWDQVQNAPREIQDLLEEVEILRHVLAATEDNQRRKVALMSAPPHILMCLRHCKEEVVRLQDLTDTLNIHLNAKSTVKRKWASTKVVVKKEMLERCRMSLGRAISLLCLSQQAYSM